jgi:hypothetical protein
MSRRSRYDEDLRRLPEDMKRVGYNADTQRYTYQDQNDGTFWEGPDGARYGRLMRGMSLELHHPEHLALTPPDIVHADQDETYEPFELVTKNIARKSPIPSPTKSVANEPPATDFDNILQGVKRQRAQSDATTLSTSSQKLSQSWKSALSFASAVGFLSKSWRNSR